MAKGTPDAPVVAMMPENVVIHRSKKLQVWLGSHPQIRLLYGARYSPRHNPVERIWDALKAYLATAPTVTIAGRLRQVHAFIRHRADDQMLHTAAPHSSPGLPEGYRQRLGVADAY